ncbi:unnamed protein product [Musa hybrid cultivar]
MGAEEEKACGAATAAVTEGVVVEPTALLDEYWFFHNALESRRRPPPRILPPTPPPSKAKEDVGSSISHHEGSITRRPSGFDGKPARKLLRAPSMPSYRTRQEESSDMACPRRKVADGGNALVRAPSLPAYCDDRDDATPRDVRDRSRTTRSSKLQHCLSSCDDQRRPQPASGCATTPNPSIPRFRPPRDWKEEASNYKYFAGHTRLFSDASYMRSIQGKKWRSYSDLESFEIQGFKDLGFVFDEEASKAGLSDVIPGLRERRNSDDGHGRVPRPYLSEAWFVERSAPPRLEWAEKRSATDMKEQLRFWARAVACNAKQDR